MNDTSPFLQVRSLSVELVRQGGNIPILSDISFDLHERQAIGIIGESGSGKTVLSHALVGEVEPPLRLSGGEIIYRGQSYLKLSREERRLIHGREIGYVGSNPGSVLDPTLPVGDQIVEKLRYLRPDMSHRKAVDRTIELMAAVRLPQPELRFREFPFQYSGGMMQRALIVDALVTNPTFLVADNITQPLDVTVAAQIIRLMRDLMEDFRTAIIFVSSSLPVVSEVAHDLIVLKDGRIVERSTPADILRAPEHPYSHELVERSPRIWASERPAPSKADAAEILQVDNVTKSYFVRDTTTLFGTNEVKAVRGVSFNVVAGENFGIVGESGCGKSTLSRLLSWIEKPDSGAIRFFGQDIGTKSHAEIKKMRQTFQLLLQDPYNALPPHMTVGRTIAEPLLIHGLESRRGIRDRVREVMNDVGVPADLYDSLLVGLSAGQRQRINLARAIVLKPKLLILDETLSALDQVEQTKLLNLLERLQQEQNLTYIFISHDLAMVSRTCNRIAVMYLGKVVELADNRSTFFTPDHPYTKALLSAVPTIEAKRFSADEHLLEGEPPSPIDIRPGCTFRSRCPDAIDRCGLSEPQLLQTGPTRANACFVAQVRTAGISAMPSAHVVAQPEIATQGD